MSSEEPSPTRDREYLDEVHDRASLMLADGLIPRPEMFATERPDLAEQVEEVLELARQVAVSGPKPELLVPGFEILGTIGQGGMGCVYLARQLRLGGRLVALKVLPATSGRSLAARTRFLREVESLAKVRHPNVVAIHDVVRQGEPLAYAMEWVDGLSLADLLRELKTRGGARDMNIVREILRAPAGSLTQLSYVVFVCRLAIAVGRGLTAVHAVGLLHRDIKPANILLRRDGTPLVSDFGLVRDDEAAAQTMTGDFLGTPSYAAPEQLRGSREDLDERADVYALGITLYHALVLQPARSGRSAVECVRELEEQPLPLLRRVDRKLPSDLETIVAKAMEIAPRHRYASASELADDLERLLDLQPIRVSPPGHVTRALRYAQRNRRSLAAALLGGFGSLVLALTIAGYLIWLPGRVDRARLEAQLELLSPHNARILYIALHEPDRLGGGLDRLYTSERFTQLRTALERYDAAILASFGRNAITLEIERAVVQFALSFLTDGDGALDPPAEWRERYPELMGLARDWSRELGPTPRELEMIARASHAELRAIGLLAFLTARPYVTEASWERINTVGTPDPLVDAALGQLLLRQGRPAQAIHRLRSSFSEFREAGFLCVDFADAAMQCGEMELAWELCAMANTCNTRWDDPYDNLIYLEAQLSELAGDTGHARDLYGLLRKQRGDPRIHESCARSWEEFGDWGGALYLRCNLVGGMPRNLEHRQALVDFVRRWWEYVPFRSPGPVNPAGVDRYGDMIALRKLYCQSLAILRNPDLAECAEPFAALEDCRPCVAGGFQLTPP